MKCRRFIFLILLVESLALVMSGCSPGLEPVLGVRLTKSGALRLYSEPCSDAVSIQYSLHGGTDEQKRYSQAWVITNITPKVALKDVRAFGEPEGWTVSREGKQSLKKEYLYDAHVELRGRDGGGRNGEVQHFTLRELGRLRNGEILVGFDDENRVMTQSEFRKTARDDC